MRTNLLIVFLLSLTCAVASTNPKGPKGIDQVVVFKTGDPNLLQESWKARSAQDLEAIEKDTGLYWSGGDYAVVSRALRLKPNRESQAKIKVIFIAIEPKKGKSLGSSGFLVENHLRAEESAELSAQEAESYLKKLADSSRKIVKVILHIRSPSAESKSSKN